MKPAPPMRTEAMGVQVAFAPGAARADVLAALLEQGYEAAVGTSAEGAASATGLSVAGEQLDGLEPDAALARVDALRAGADRPEPKAWKPWFPVIDFDRCTDCMQCLSFCLFDVYGVDGAGQIQVQNQDNCKTDCPACSRVCPEVAILFPKYKKGPINGAEIKQEDLEREAMKVDISALLGGDLYGALRDRQKSARKRFSTERDASKALLERKRCLKKLKKQLDIPDEVLMTLPSAEDIEARAERARAKLARRRAASQTVRDTRPPPSADDWGI